MRFIKKVVTLLAVAGTFTASAQAQRFPAPKEKPTVVTVPRYLKALRYVYPYSHHNGNFLASRGGQKGTDRLTRLRHRAKGPKTRSMMRRLTLKRQSKWRWHGRIDVITPYGQWAIPSYIVYCESHGYWNAYNPSGASGPYQLLGWGAPMPANTARARAAHHEIAASVWNGGAGRSNWVC